jgi:hypothetical protein
MLQSKHLCGSVAACAQPADVALASKATIGCLVWRSKLKPLGDSNYLPMDNCIYYVVCTCSSTDPDFACCTEGKGCCWMVHCLLMLLIHVSQ